MWCDSRVLVTSGGKPTKMLIELLNLDCGLGGDFYFLLYLCGFSAINNTTYITYNKKLQETILLLEKETHIKVYERNPTPHNL